MYIYIYLHERISEACIGRPSRGMSSNPSHSLMPTSPWWLWNLYSWGKSLQNPLVKAGFDSSAFPFFNGHTRGIQGIHIFRHTHMCNAGQQPAGSHMQFSPPPKKKSSKPALKTILSNTFPAVFQAQYIHYPSKLLVYIYIYHQYIIIMINRSKPRLPLSPLSLFTALRALHVWVVYRYVIVSADLAYL